jgi:hypothetical protein
VIVYSLSYFIWNELSVEKKKTELEGLKAAQLELEQNIQSKFKGLTSELEASIKRFHTEMKLKETCRNDVSILVPLVASVSIGLCSCANIFREGDRFLQEE